MALTQYFVDPTSGTDSVGKGAIGDPYLSVQFCLNDIDTTHGGRDATNGDQINIKAGASDDVLTATLSLATYGTPTVTAHLVFRGYTTAADDGGIGGIDGDATYAIFAGANYVHWIDLHLHNSGSATILIGTASACINNCEIDTTTGIAVSSGKLWNCHIHTFGTYGVQSATIVIKCYFSDASATAAIRLNSTGSKAYGNMISIAGNTQGIRLESDNNTVIFNSVLAASGSGIGIYKFQANKFGSQIVNNLVEGFTSGDGINIGTLSEPINEYGHNAVFDCGTKYTGAGRVILTLGDNEDLSETPFAKSGSDTFANRFTYFAPVDTGNVHGGSYPLTNRRDKGAVQHAGGTTIIKRPRRVM